MKAEYVDHMGSDLSVVNAARVSFDKHVNELGEKDARLIRYLAKHNHFTPFTHATITLRETIPIFTARQRFKHTVGFSYNEVSRRYVDDKPEFYYPEEWRLRAENIKQGSSEETIEELELDEHLVWDDPGSPRLTNKVSTMYNALIDHAKSLYDLMLRNGVAPEQARMVLPQSMYTSYYVTGSLFAWARAYNLRSDSHAQKEIQGLAEQWDVILSSLFPVSWEALTKEIKNA